MALEYFTQAKPRDAACSFLVKNIDMHLEFGEHVLWLVSGGSNIELAVDISNRLGNLAKGRLTLMLVDERFGEPGHHDSNWQQLLDAGLKLSGASLQPTLRGDNLDVTVTRFAEQLNQSLANVDWSVALLGMGIDGHIAGILPNSPAVESLDMAVGYEAADYTRITITPAGLAQLDEAVMFAAGDTKKAQLARLKTDLPESQQPAQVIKRIPSVHIYTN